MKVLVIGGGIGGLTTALNLHAQGIECEVFEQSPTIRELGVGINLLPHAIKALTELGLFEALDEVAIHTRELIYTNRFGQEIWRELRGKDAGYDHPQISIHRGKLQAVLHKALEERIGQGNIHTDNRLMSFVQDGDCVNATFLRRNTPDKTVRVSGDALIAADGIHSTVRRTFYPDEGDPKWNGFMLWRGAVECAPFLSGRSMLVAGGMQAKVVLYPVTQQKGTPATNLVYWGVLVKLGDGSAPPARREDWKRLGQLDELLPYVEGVFQLPDIDPVEIIRSTPEFYEYPMCDRDPLPKWSFSRVTLLGDAAHPMYPVGSNGASQAILDASCLAQMLAGSIDVVTALATYESIRLPATSQIVLNNRVGGPERVIDMVEERAPDGFTHLDDVASQKELEAIVKGYSKMAGFDQTQVNR